MKRVFSLLTAILLAGTVTVSAKERLKVLYVGGSANFEVGFDAPERTQEEIDKSVKERMDHFTKFLRERFTTVKSVKADKYSPAMSAAYDVTIFDATPEPLENPDVHELIYKQSLPMDFSDAAVMIADKSETIGRTLGTKNDWMCLCLENYALRWNREHPIFNGPFKVDLNEEYLPTPPHMVEIHTLMQRPAPDSIPQWKVSDENYAEDPNYRIGLVSRGDSYADSPEAEVISGGKCGKDLGAVAIGRHGNFFHWGFASDPVNMTQAGRDVFANAIVYAAKFKGKRVIAKKFNENIPTRKDATAWIPFLLDKARWKQTEESNAQVLASGMELRDPSFFQPKSYGDFVKEQYPALYPVLGADPNEYVRFYTINHPYLRPSEDGYTLAVDDDLRSLFLPIDSVSTLEKAAELWAEGGIEAEKGKRILNRYTLCRFETPAEYQTWIADNRDKLFFTEAGGYVWLIDNNDPHAVGNEYSILYKEMNDRNDAIIARSRAWQAEAKAKEETELTSDPSNPVALAGEIVTNGDGTREFVISMKVHNGFHTYAKVDDEDPYIVTKIDFVYPEGVDPAGEIILPPSRKSQNATEYYEGNVQFRQPVKGSGNGEISAKVRYQACDQNGCMRPTTVTLSKTI